MSKSDVHGAKRFVRPVTYGMALGVVSCVLLLILMSVVMSFRDIPQTVVSLMATISFVVGGFVAGYISAIFAREKGMLLGLVCGILLFLVLSIASLATQHFGFGVSALSKLAAVLFAAAIGGIIGVNKRKKFR